MKKVLISFMLLAFISVSAKAQLDSYLKKQHQKPLPKSFYTGQSFNSSIRIKDAKAEKVGSNKLFYLYQLPLDNMLCAVPNNQVKCHINLCNPQASIDYYTDNIPNALPKVDVLK